jgi:hypothetical protein
MENDYAAYLIAHLHQLCRMHRGGNGQLQQITTEQASREKQYFEIFDFAR